MILSLRPWWQRLFSRRPAASGGDPARAGCLHVESLEDRRLLTLVAPLFLVVQRDVGSPISLRIDAADRPVVEEFAKDGTVPTISSTPNVASSLVVPTTTELTASHTILVAFGADDPGVLIGLPTAPDVALNVRLVQGDSTYQLSLRLPQLPGVNLLGVRVTDYNDDGLADLVAWGQAADGSTTTQVFLGQADGSFQMVGGLQDSVSLGLLATRLLKPVDPVAAPPAVTPASSAPQPPTLPDGALKADVVASSRSTSETSVNTPASTRSNAPSTPSVPAKPTGSEPLAGGKGDSSAAKAREDSPHDPFDALHDAVTTISTPTANFSSRGEANLVRHDAPALAPSRSAMPVNASRGSIPLAVVSSSPAAFHLPSHAVDIVLGGLDALTLFDLPGTPVATELVNHAPLDKTLPYDDMPRGGNEENTSAPLPTIAAGIGQILAQAMFSGRIKPEDAASSIVDPSESALGVADLVQRSTDSLTRLVQGFYRLFLGRAAVVGEEQGWVQLLLSGQTEESVLTHFLGTAEFVDRATTIGTGTSTDERYVQSVYTFLLGRSASETELDGWLGALPTLGRGGVITFLLQSVEYRALSVASMYQDAGVNPTEAETAAWATSPFDLGTIRKFVAM